MRPVLYSDLRAAALAVLAVPEGARPSLCTQLLREADFADKFVRRTGRLHPDWGNGTLMAVARLRHLASDRTFDDPGYCSAFQLILSGLIARKIG